MRFQVDYTLTILSRGGVPMGRGFPLGRGAKGKDGEPKPDLQKLGMKFGGQISITSTGNQAKKSDRGNDGQVGSLYVQNPRSWILVVHF